MLACCENATRVERQVLSVECVAEACLLLKRPAGEGGKAQ